MHIQLERHTTSTLLGIRFWDPVTDTQISDSLIVTARPATVGSARAAAFTTLSGVYAFQGLPGLREIENRSLEELIDSPPATQEFIVEVTDRRGRFLPLAFRVMLPLPERGLYSPFGSPPGEEQPGFYLFSSPARRVPPGAAVVRASLVRDDTGEPAAYAVLVVQIDEDEAWYGIADSRGEVAVIFPYPMFTGALGTSPPGPAPAEQQWDVTIGVRYLPGVLSYPVDSDVPDLASILAQSAATIVTDDGDPPAADLAQALAYGRELVLRSGEGSTLRILTGI